MFRRAALWAIAIAVPLSGCDKVFGLDESAPGVDATPSIDGPPDVSECNAVQNDYPITLPSAPGHRYRISLEQKPIGLHEIRCAADAPDNAHLFAPASHEQFVDMRNFLVDKGMTGDQLFIGGIQAPDQASVDAGWRLITGEKLDITQWGTNEPDDGGDMLMGRLVENNAENAAELWLDVRLGLIDIVQGDAHGAICECDDRRADPAVQDILDLYL